MLQHLTHTIGYTKNSHTESDNIFATYNIIRIKNYLKLLYSNLNSPQEEAVPYQALAIAIIKKTILFSFI